MGYFTIHLPDNKKGDVRYGPVKKMKKLSHRFKRKNFEEEQPAYIVRVDADRINERRFYLIKTRDGKWMDTITDELSAIIQYSIDQYERRFMTNNFVLQS